MPAMSDSADFDVFISHSSADKVWVEALARNLKDRGYRVWLDAWQLVPGRDFLYGLEEGLERSKAGVIVVTPESQESGWVRDEYTRMQRRRHDDLGFVILPVLYGAAGDFPFLRNLQAIDFRDPAVYRRSFYLLLCGLRGEPPGPDVQLDGPLEVPASPEPGAAVRSGAQGFLEQVLDDLEQDHLGLLLAQEGMADGSATQALLDGAAARFGPNHVLHLVPPRAWDVDAGTYFALIGKQARLEGDIVSAERFQQGLHQRLKIGEKLFVLVTEFENGPDEGRQRLASGLRSLYEEFPGQLRILFRGGERLADLKYDQGTISILNIAAEYIWPELTVADVCELQHRYQPDEALSDGEAQVILEVSGGEPRLVRHCLKLRRTASSLDQAGYQKHLVQDGVVWQFFTPLVHHPSAVDRVCGWLRQNTIGPWTPYLADPLLRRLYWRNLLAKRFVGGRVRLYWRCRALRIAGREILGCS